MSKPATPTRLVLRPLDDRAVPSVVSSVAVSAATTARPFDFVATGTLTTTDQTSPAGGVPLTNTSTTAVSLAGSLDYTSNTSGQTGPVVITGTGTGSEIPTHATDTGGVGAYAQTVQGQWAFTDTNGSVVTGGTPFGVTASFLSGASLVGSRPIGPSSPAGTFDVSTFQLHTLWTGAGAATGSTSQGDLTATLAAADSKPTAFTFSGQTATLMPDGSVSVNFTANVTGDLLKAASETAAATSVTAQWVGNGQAQAVSLNLPIYWNTGSLTGAVTGLIPPAWAQKLVVQVDAAHKVTGADLTNATWTVTLADLTPVSPPPVVSPPVVSPPVVPPVVPPVSPPPVVSPPVVSSPPTPVPAAFNLSPGSNQLLDFRDAAGQLIGQSPTFDSFSGTVSLAVADVNGDGVPDAVLAAGAGGGPRVKVLDGKTGDTLADFFAFDPDSRGGVTVAATTLTRTGAAEIIAGAGVGDEPDVRVFDGTGTLLSQFLAYDPSFTGGVNVAVADLNNDGLAEIITGTGVGGGPVVRVFDRTTGVSQQDILIANPDSRTGVQVTAAVSPVTKQVTVTADPGAAGPAVRFRSQLSQTGPLLVNVSDPLPVTVDGSQVA